MTINILFAPSHPNALPPTRGTDGAAAFDLYAAAVYIENGKVVVNTGLRTSFPSDHVLLVFPRSGLSRKHGLSLTNGVGVIDSDYRGDLLIVMNAPDPLHVVQNILHPGMRCAQAILLPLPAVRWIETDKLDDTVRGEGGFGSTGVHA